jgi:hypothetical protein
MIACTSPIAPPSRESILATASVPFETRPRERGGAVGSGGDPGGPAVGRRWWALNINCADKAVRLPETIMQGRLTIMLERDR